MIGLDRAYRAMRWGIILVALFCVACQTTTKRARGYYIVVVKKGESLAEIAQKFDTTWQEIARDNKLGAWPKIEPGQKLKVRPGPGGYIAGSFHDSTQVLWNQSWNDSSKKFIWPVVGTISSHFGARRGSLHEGIDIAAESGHPVVAAAGGTVSFVGWMKGYGRTILLNHGSGYETRYAHLARFLVKRGQFVDKGEKIAAVGRSGHATGPHLHFEVLYKSKPRDPLVYLAGDSTKLAREF